MISARVAVGVVVLGLFIIMGRNSLVLGAIDGYYITSDTNTLHHFTEAVAAEGTSVCSVTGGHYYAGDFVRGKNDLIYVVNDVDHSLYTISTAGCVATFVTSTDISGKVTGMSWSTVIDKMYILYVSAGQSTLATIDLGTGITSTVLTHAAEMCDIAAQPDGNLYAYDGIGTMWFIRISTLEVLNGGWTGFTHSTRPGQGLSYDPLSAVTFVSSYITSEDFPADKVDFASFDAWLGFYTPFDTIAGVYDADCLCFGSSAPESSSSQSLSSSEHFSPQCTARLPITP